MAFALLTIGLVLLVSAVRNTQGDFFTLVKGDFTGPNNFVYWIAAIGVIGAVGYIPKLKPLSTAFLVLVVLVLVITRGNPNGVGGGLFEKLTAGLKTTTASAPDMEVGPGKVTGVNPPPSIDLGSYFSTVVH